MAARGTEEAIHIQDTGHLSDRDIADATGAAPSTVREWLMGLSAPSGALAERLTELSSIIDRLSRVIRPTYIPSWLNRSMDLLDDELGRFQGAHGRPAPQATAGRGT